MAFGAFTVSPSSGEREKPHRVGGDKNSGVTVLRETKRREEVVKSRREGITEGCE